MTSVIKLDDMDIYEIGNTIQLSGIIYSGKGDHYLAFLPGEIDDSSFRILDMDLEDWKRFIRQTDILETKIIDNSSDPKKAKTILRKSARQIDARVSWRVYQRDKYTCRYCGLTGIPLTVDHLVLWEDGGPSIEENLLTSCKKCNKLRGNTLYDEWLKSDIYKRRSKKLRPNVKIANEFIDLSKIVRVSHIKNR